ncbi:MAG: thioredoxin family protein [Candidatus Cloacimonadaceae bacterium]
MKFIRCMIVFAVLIMLWGCKGKTEQLETTELIQTEVTDSVIVEDKVEASAKQETQTSEPEQVVKKEPVKQPEPAPEKKSSYQVYFLEIGSVNCIPCRMMQPIMKEIERDYAGIVKVEFYDLMDDREIGPRYNIRVMPTQVFLDADGREFFRHEGFYPKEELSKMLDAYLAKLPN